MVSKTTERTPNITVDEIVSAAYAGFSISELAESAGISEKSLKQYILKVWPDYLFISPKISAAKAARHKWWRKLKSLRNPQHLELRFMAPSIRRIVVNTFPTCFWGKVSKRSIATRRRIASVDMTLLDLFNRRIATGKYYDSEKGEALIRMLLGTSSSDILDLVVGIDTRNLERAQEKYRKWVENGNSLAAAGKKTSHGVRVKRIWLDPVWEYAGRKTFASKREFVPCNSDGDNR